MGISLNFLQLPACLSFVTGGIGMLYYLLDVDIPFEWLDLKLKLILLLLVLELLLLYPHLLKYVCLKLGITYNNASNFLLSLLSIMDVRFKLYTTFQCSVGWLSVPYLNVI